MPCLWMRCRTSAAIKIRKTDIQNYEIRTEPNDSCNRLGTSPKLTYQLGVRKLATNAANYIPKNQMIVNNAESH